MRLSVSKSKNAKSFYVIKDYYSNGKRTSKVIEKLGTETQLKDKLGDIDVYAWAKDYIDVLNKREQEGIEPNVIEKFSPTTLLDKSVINLYKGGYLFLEKIYHDLKLDKICSDISKKYKFDFDLNFILSRLLYSRILFPSSKLSTNEISKSFLEEPNFELHHVYRALDIIAKESDFIQSSLYKNSLKVSNRSTDVLYYDCTNYFFEIEQEAGIKKYGHSKENRPNPIVQMGLFMDGNGIPLAFDIHPGNLNEQSTLTPLEKKIIKDFHLSKFVVCTDAGLSSTANRKFNDVKDRFFITTQSLKKLKGFIKNWALDSTGWKLSGSSKEYDLKDLDSQKYYDSIFYKERWINENSLEQRLIVSFSFKYRDYQRKIRHRQIERALNIIDKNPGKATKNGQNDAKRFIKKTSVTADGEIASKDLLSLNEDQIVKEAIYDGFYGVCTNLEDKVSEILNVNKRRWKIEECFRVMKSEFKARPVYLSNDERIKAHFSTCFMALILFRILEQKLDNKYTCYEIIDTLSCMDFLKLKSDGYVPAYTRTDLTDELHEKFGFRTDYQVLTSKALKNILKKTKS